MSSPASTPQPDGTQSSSSPAAPTAVDCADGYLVTIAATTIARLSDSPAGPSYTTTMDATAPGDPRVTLTGGDASGGIDAALRIGESAAHTGVGTFTLLAVEGTASADSSEGSAGSATFCFMPDDGFRLSERIPRASDAVDTED